MAKKSRFVYRGDKRSVESVSRKSRQSGGAFDSFLAGEVQKYKPGDKENTIRILPPSWDEKDDARWGDGWDIQAFLHYNVGPDKATYLCLDKMRGETCPVCEARRQASDDDERDALKPKSTFLCWIVDRDNEKAGPQVWSMPITVFRDINLRSVDKKHNQPIPIDDPEEGYDIVFSKEGTGIKTKYSGIEVAREATPLHDDERQQARWLEYITEHPLPEILQFFEAEHIESVLFGKSERGEDDGDDDRGASRSKRGGGSTARSRRSDDEEDYLADEEEKADADEEEVEEEKPRGRARGKPSRRQEPENEPDEEDADDVDEEEEVEEEKPRRGGKKPARGRDRDPEPEEDEEEESDEDEPDEEEEESTTSRAKKKVSELQRRRSRR